MFVPTTNVLRLNLPRHEKDHLLIDSDILEETQTGKPDNSKGFLVIFRKINQLPQNYGIFQTIPPAL